MQRANLAARNCMLMESRLIAWALMTSALFASCAQAACYRDAAARYGVQEGLLRAIAKVESGSARADKVENRNANGTRDIGRMQINSAWLPTLKQFGIAEQELRDECISIQVGAWILAQNQSRHGPGWEAVGAYNVGCRNLSAQECSLRRNRYAWKVFNALKADATPSATTPVAEQPSSLLAQVSFEE